MHHAPFGGTVIKVTRANMVQVVADLNASTVACLTEARIVDALLDACSALPVPEQEPDSDQCRRLRNRGVPFAMIDEEAMAKLDDGVHVVVDGQQLLVFRG